MPDTPTVASNPFIRLYNPKADHDSVIHIFRETCDDSLKVEPIWTIGSYLWARPYFFLEPKTCLVLDDGHGKAVGYIIGTPETSNFCERWTKDYVPAVKDETSEESLPVAAQNQEDVESLTRRRKVLLGLLRNDPWKLVYGDYAKILEPYSGHMHIDILPSHQRRGYGKQLVQAFREAMKTQGCTGVYLGMVATNESAKQFYQACGFTRLPHVLDEGVSGELGRTSTREDGGESIYFVMSF